MRMRRSEDEALDRRMNRHTVLDRRAHPAKTVRYTVDAAQGGEEAEAYYSIASTAPVVLLDMVAAEEA